MTVDTTGIPVNPSGYPAFETTDGNMSVRDPYGAGAYGNLYIDTAIFVAGQLVISGGGTQLIHGTAVAGPSPSKPTVWALSTATVLVLPLSFWKLTGDDGQWINAAATYLMNTYAISGQSSGAGVIELGPWQYNLASQVTLPEHLSGVADQFSIQPVSLRGVRGATVIMQTSSVGFYKHRTHMWGAVQNNNPNPMAYGGSIKDITIDLQNAPVGAVGVDMGDLWGGLLDVCIKNAVASDGSGTNIGFWQADRVAWSEKCRWLVHSINNDTGMLVDLQGGSISHEYNDTDLYVWLRASSGKPIGQRAMRFTNGRFQGGGSIRMRGNCQSTGGTTAPYFLGCDGSDGLGNFSQIFNTNIDIIVESNGNANNPYLINLGSSSNSIRGYGAIKAQFSNWATSQLNGGQFAFVGPVEGDSVLTTPNFTIGATTVAKTYRGVDANMFIVGGTISLIKINGTSIPTTTPNITVRDGMTIQFNYTVAPTLTFVPLSQ